MPNDQFTVNAQQLKQLAKLYKQNPRAFAKASFSVLNSLAVNTRVQQLTNLSTTMTIRDRKFLRNTVRFQLSKRTLNINNQSSASGSVKRARHDGWIGQETGKQSRITKFTDEGRRGNDKNKSIRGVRADKTNTQTKDYKLIGTGDARMNNFLQRIASDPKRRRKPFYLPKRFKRMQKGVYKFKGGKAGSHIINGFKYKSTLRGAKIVRMSRPDSIVNPKITRWNTKARKKVATEQKTFKFWEEALERQLLSQARRLGINIKIGG